MGSGCEVQVCAKEKGHGSGGKYNYSFGLLKKVVGQNMQGPGSVVALAKESSEK
jgi:hypothetical protein